MSTSNNLALMTLALTPLYGFIVVVAVPFSVFLWRKLTSIEDKQDSLEKRIEENHDHITDVRGTHNPKSGCNQCKPKWRHDHNLPPFEPITKEDI